MKMRHAGGRRVSVFRDSWPAKGDQVPQRLAVEAYEHAPRPVARSPKVDTPKLQTYEVEEGPDGDKLLAALKQGPAKVRPIDGAWVLDIHRIEPPR